MGGNTQRMPATVARRRRMRPVMMLVCLLLLILLVWKHDTANAEETLSAAARPDTADSSRLPIPFPFLSKIGLQTGFVSTGDLDTGVDFGARAAKSFYQDFLEVTTTAHLWGATNDSLDVTTAAFDMSFCYKIPIRRGIIGYAGIVLGYGFVYSEKAVASGGETVLTNTSHHDFQKFITAGAEFDTHGNRTAFAQCRYGTTRLSRELHFTAGLNFYTKYKKFIPWLAPPLMRD